MRLATFFGGWIVDGDEITYLKLDAFEFKKTSPSSENVSYTYLCSNWSEFFAIPGPKKKKPEF